LNSAVARPVEVEGHNHKEKGAIIRQKNFLLELTFHGCQFCSNSTAVDGGKISGGRDYKGLGAEPTTWLFIQFYFQKINAFLGIF